MEDPKKSPEWEVMYDTDAGKFYFSNLETGETRWDPPPEFEDVYRSMPDVKALEGIPAGVHKAAKVIQQISRLKARRRPKQQFEKILDTETGRFYYKQTATGATTWDTPTGHYPMAPLPPSKTHGAKLEQEMIRARRKRVSEERRLLIAKRRDEHARQVREREAREGKKGLMHGLEVWNEAFKNAVATGELKLQWQKLGVVHEDLTRFDQRFGKHLQSLKLVGHELRELPFDFGDGSLRSLTSLNLASNHLNLLPDSLCKLGQLRVLNLLRNKLVALPPRVGQLSSLETLLISSNRLESLPYSFGNLSSLGRVEVNANKLTYLPESLGRLRCHSLILNGNLLGSLTPAVAEMSNLRFLSLCSNKLEYLPKEIGECANLQRLHLSSNNLLDLPESLGQCTALRELNLSQNDKLSALPETFYELSNLQSLHAEMCPSLVFPPLEYLVKGPSEVLKWSEGRIAHTLHVKRQRMVDRLTNLLLQLVEQEPFFGKAVKAFFFVERGARFGELVCHRPARQ